MVSQALALDPDGTLRPRFLEQRAYPRFAISLGGVCAVERGEDMVCSALDVSLGGMAVRSKARAFIGQAASVLLPQIGLVHGQVARTWADGFALRLDDGAAQRRRILNYLTWLVAGEPDGSSEDRRSSERIVPLRRLVTLTTRAGATCMARIIDISRSGVAVTTTAAAAVGDAIHVGTTGATVARVFEGGFAARFATPIEGVFDVSVRL